MDVYTEEGITGTIQLSQLNKKETSKNLIDMSSEVKWYVYPNFNTSDYYGKNIVLKGYTLQYQAATNDKKADLRILVTSVEEVKDAYLAETFNEGKGQFTFDDKVLPEGSTYVWKHSTYDGAGYMKASAYINKACKAAESWLVSPEVDLTSATTAKLSFEHALNNLNSGNINDHIALMVKKAGAEWTAVTIPQNPAGNSYDYVNSGDINLAAYVGGKFQFAFKYVSTTAISPTWQIRKVVVE
jgi:hypothetical protein